VRYGCEDGFLTRSVNDRVAIFFIMCPRCIFTVISTMPLFNRYLFVHESADDQPTHHGSRGWGLSMWSVRDIMFAGLVLACSPKLPHSHGQTLLRQPTHHGPRGAA
jgi:hypothetical protein